MAIGVHSRGWATALANPIIGDDASDAYQHQQDHLRDISERVSVEHLMSDSTTTDGQHLIGSARSGSGSAANQPVNRTTTSQDGPANLSTGGNEEGRLYKITSGTGSGSLMISDGTQWTDAIESLQGDFSTNIVDLLSGVTFTLAGDASSAMDLHAHQGRHTDQALTTAADFDYLANVIKALTISGTYPITNSNQPPDGSDNDHGTVAITATGRRSATTRGLIIASGWLDQNTDGQAVIGISTDGTSANHTTDSVRTINLNGSNDGRSFICIAYVSALSAAVHTYHLVTTDLNTCDFDVMNTILFAIDLGVTS